MVIRQEPDGYLLIGQPAHAFLAGQLARAWGREPFGDFEPREGGLLGRRST
ncbi:MAG: hypothetical protein KatS3mg115_2145 [Candidatus Poribacteria bacterium]|nr:MAG: hypothetical protein KatS3mg115_2145 [Candidatus Poribacteria bacterium]